MTGERHISDNFVAKLRQTIGLLAVGVALLAPAAPARSMPLNTWQPIGPAPIDGFFPGGVSGRATAIAVNPANWNQVFLGTASGGVWYSPDKGVTWKPLSDDTVSLAIGDIDLRGCNIQSCQAIFAGTGENAIRRDTYHGQGLLIGSKIDNSPTYSWTLSDGWPATDFRHMSLNDVILAPVSGEVFVTASSGVTVSSSEATVTGPLLATNGYGLYRRAAFGDTWTMLTVDGTDGARPTDLEMDPTNEDILYAGFLGKGVFKSVNGGDDWCPLNDGIVVPGCTPPTNPLPDPAQVTFDHVEIALYAADPDRMYVTLGHCPDRFLQRCLPSLYKSTTAGDSWDLQMSGTTSEGGSGGYKQLPYGYSRYTHALTVDPANDTRLWMGGLRLFLSNTSGVHWWALDYNGSYGASVWGPLVHLDHHDLVINPANPFQMYNTNDGGFYVSETAGNSWIPRNDGLQITGFQSIAASPLTNVVIGGTQDNSANMWTGTDTWTTMPCCGDSGFTAIDAVNPDVMYAGHNYGVVKRSIDGGKTWCEVMSGITSGPEAFYAPFVQDPTSPHDLYYGSTKLYRGQVTGPNCGDFSWTAVSPSIPQSFNDEIPGLNNVITAISVAPNNQNRIYFGTYDGEIFHTDAACTTSGCWTDTSSTIPDVPITRIAVDPGDHENAWVSLSGFHGIPHVFGTTDSGASWTSTVSGLPQSVAVNTIHFEPGTTETLWVGMDGNLDGESVWRSLDGGASWTSESDGMPNVPVYEIVFVPGTPKVFAATHGRGAWALGSNLLMPKGNWVDGKLAHEWLVGWMLPPNEACTLRVLQQDGTECAAGTEDAMGGTLFTDDRGVLRTSKANMWSGRQGAFACFDGICAGDTPVANCNDVANPPDQVVVECGAATATAIIKGVMTKAAPASSQLALGLVAAAGGAGSAQMMGNGQPGTVAGGQLGSDGAEGPSMGPLAGSFPARELDAGSVMSAMGGSFDLTAAVHAGDGTTRSLCTVPVMVMAGDTTTDILTSAMNALNNDATCDAATVKAALVTGGDMSSEDDFERDPTLTLTAPGVTGTQLLTAISVAPGELTGTCFQMQSLGLPVHDQALAPAIRFTTSPGGAGGGQVTVVEETPLGTCSVSVDTTAGETAAEIVTKLVDAFHAPGIPGPNPGCPADENPRDVVPAPPLPAEKLETVLTNEVEVCITDPEVGFVINTSDLPNSHPGAVAQAAPSTECTSPAGAQVLLDGSASTDPDSSPGTNDDIVLFEWYEDFGTASQVLLGTGELFLAQLAIGTHQITLQVTDSGSLTAIDNITVSVVDTTPPTVSGTVSPSTLYPPNHTMVPVTASVSASDACALTTDLLLILNTATSDEPDDAPGPSDGATVNDIRDAQVGTLDLTVKLRAERDSLGSGRTYTLNYKATDLASNSGNTSLTVFVPLSDGSTEPTIVVTEATPVGTILYWPASPSANYYNIIKGRLSFITDDGEDYDLGTTECVEAASTDTNTAGNEDATIPPLGDGWFYLVEPANGYLWGYGTMTALKQRLPTPLDPCNPTGP